MAPPLPTTAQIFSEEHKQWLRHSMTATLLKVLTKHENGITDKLSRFAVDMDKTPELIRLLTAQLGNTKTIINLIKDTETFASKSYETNN